MDVLPWLVASAGDEDDEEYSMGEDAKGSDIFARSVSTTDVALGREVVLLSGCDPGGLP